MTLSPGKTALVLAAIALSCATGAEEPAAPPTAGFDRFLSSFPTVALPIQITPKNVFQEGMKQPIPADRKTCYSTSNWSDANLFAWGHAAIGSNHLFIMSVPTTDPAKHTETDWTLLATFNASGAVISTMSIQTRETAPDHTILSTTTVKPDLTFSVVEMRLAPQSSGGKKQAGDVSTKCYAIDPRGVPRVAPCGDDPAAAAGKEEKEAIGRLIDAGLEEAKRQIQSKGAVRPFAITGGPGGVTATVEPLLPGTPTVEETRKAVLEEVKSGAASGKVEMFALVTTEDVKGSAEGGTSGILRIRVETRAGTCGDVKTPYLRSADGSARLEGRLDMVTSRAGEVFDACNGS